MCFNGTAISSPGYCLTISQFFTQSPQQLLAGLILFKRYFQSSSIYIAINKILSNGQSKHISAYQIINLSKTDIIIIDMKYRDCISRLSKLVPSFNTKSRNDFTRLLADLGNPHLHQKYIHITGTNGKGSVSLKIAKILELSGIKTGLYTSPHLYSYTERIQINGKNISQSDFVYLFTKIEQTALQKNLQINFFEALTAMAFMHYHLQSVEFVSLEVGIGGTLDSTNVIVPEMSIITSIGLDHTEVLGPTLRDIATQKSGIIKPNRPVLLGVNCQPFDVFVNKCKETNSPLYRMDESFGDYERQNNELVRKCIEILAKQNKGLKVSQMNIAQGIRCKQGCRFEVLSQHPKLKNSIRTVVFDVGHNPPAISKLCQKLKKEYPSAKITVLFGASSRKDVNTMIQILKSVTQDIYFVEARHFRALKVEHFLKKEHPEPITIIGDGNIHKTLDHIIDHSSSQVLLVCGSFFIMEEAKGYFDPRILDNSENFT